MEAHIYRVKAKGQAHKSQRYDNKTKRPKPQAAAKLSQLYLMVQRRARLRYSNHIVTVGGEATC